MAAETSPNQSQIPTFEQTTPVADVFSLATVHGVAHRIDTHEREFLWIDDGVEYPRDVNKDDPIAELMLEQVGSGPAVFRLPQDYISLQHVLNEAVGARGSGERFAPEEAGPQAVRQALSRIGEAVGVLALRGKLIPRTLNYRHIILERNHKLHPRLIPPTEFADTTALSPANQLQRLRRSLGTSMYQGAVSPDQRILVGVGLDAFYTAAVQSYRGKQ